jgi:hypothetical protein
MSAQHEFAIERRSAVRNGNVPRAVMAGEKRRCRNLKMLHRNCSLFETISGT